MARGGTGRFAPDGASADVGAAAKEDGRTVHSVREATPHYAGKVLECSLEAAGGEADQGDQLYSLPSKIVIGRAAGNRLARLLPSHGGCALPWGGRSGVETGNQMSRNSLGGLR